MCDAGVGSTVNVKLVDLTKTEPYAGQLRLYALVALRYIPPGEELPLDYGRGYGARVWRHNGACCDCLCP